MLAHISVNGTSVLEKTSDVLKTDFIHLHMPKFVVHLMPCAVSVPKTHHSCYIYMNKTRQTDLF